MVIVKDTKQFIEKFAAPIVIFGTSNAAYWTGYYLNKCNIDFAGYFDESVGNEPATCNGKPVFNLTKLLEYANSVDNRELRLIIPDINFERDLNNAELIEQQNNLKFTCLAPVYKVSKKVTTYNINKMLGYFRFKLMKLDYPTIITNECAAGPIYEHLGMFYLSPMINTNVPYEDYIKLCYNPKKYLVPITDSMRRKYWYSPTTTTDHGFVPAVKIEDIEISFPHDKNFEVAKNRWNFLVEHVNFNRLIYVLVNSNGAIPFKILKDFAAVNGEKLIFHYGEMFSFPFANDIIYVNREKLLANDEAIENSFDLVGWINRDYELG